MFFNYRVGSIIIIVQLFFMEYVVFFQVVLYSNMFSFSICIMLKFKSFEFKYEQKKNVFIIVVLKTNLK